MGRRRKRTGNMISDFERELKDGSVCQRDNEINFVKNIDIGNKLTVYPFVQTEIHIFEFEFIKSYLFALNTGALSNNRLKVINYASMGSLSHPVIIPPLVVNSDENGMALISNDIVYLLIRFDGSDYQVTVYLKFISSYGHETIKHFISVVGIQPDSYKTAELASHIKNESIRHSYYKNKLLSLTLEDDQLKIDEIAREEFEEETLEEIFVPVNIIEELKRFCFCLDQFSQLGLGLRFLLCGEPGTGKTKSVRSIINTCYGKASILLINGQINFKKLFEFAELLEPVIICLDDLDLIVGSRDHHFSPGSLSAFLQELDGFRKNNVFLLATTNDKNLIDQAASRPGRFDLLIDFSRLDKNNYVDLIRTHCINDRILSVFDENMLDKLRKKRVTGAFITNLIKQLEIKLHIQPDGNLYDYANNLIELSYHGFYKKKEEKEMSFGFNGHDD